MFARFCVGENELYDFDITNLAHIRIAEFFLEFYQYRLSAKSYSQLYLAWLIESIMGYFAFQGITPDERGDGSGRTSSLDFRSRVHWGVRKSRLFIDKDIIGRNLSRRLLGR